jgi:shikimate kinase
MTFVDCDNLISVTLGREVENIGWSAFSSCENLGVIIVYATNAPILSGGILEIENIIAIYVPSGSVDAYKTAEYWTQYADKIMAIG